MQERMYYVLDTRTYVGNCALFWAKNSAGYTCDPAEAHVYTETEIKGHSWRATDVPVLKDEVDAALVRHLRVDTDAYQHARRLSEEALGACVRQVEWDVKVAYVLCMAARFPCCALRRTNCRGPKRCPWCTARQLVRHSQRTRRKAKR